VSPWLSLHQCCAATAPSRPATIVLTLLLLPAETAASCNVPAPSASRARIPTSRSMAAGRRARSQLRRASNGPLAFLPPHSRSARAGGDERVLRRRSCAQPVAFGELDGVGALEHTSRTAGEQADAVVALPFLARKRSGLAGVRPPPLGATPRSPCALTTGTSLSSAQHDLRVLAARSAAEGAG